MAWSSNSPGLALLDLDGTLCDPREGIFKGFGHALDALGLPCPELSHLQPLIGLPLLECFQKLGVGASSEAAARHFQAFFEARGYAEAHLYPGAADLLHALKSDGWRLAIVTAKPTFAAEFVCQSLGITDLIDAGIHGCPAQELSPNKSMILSRALGALESPALPPAQQGGGGARRAIFGAVGGGGAGGGLPNKAFLLGDRSQDRDAALHCGLPFLAAGWGFGEPAEHEGAWAVAATPGHSLELIRARYSALGAA